MESGSRRAFAAALATAAAVALAACGSRSAGESGTGSDTELAATPLAQVTASPPSDAKVIGVSVDGETVSPSGATVQVKPGQPVVFEIDATEAGELHVHSSPGTSIQYPAGKSQAQITIDKPGVVEAEIEELGKLVVQLEVR